MGGRGLPPEPTHLCDGAPLFLMTEHAADRATGRHEPARIQAGARQGYRPSPLSSEPFFCSGACLFVLGFSFRERAGAAHLCYGKGALLDATFRPKPALRTPEAAAWAAVVCTRVPFWKSSSFFYRGRILWFSFVCLFTSLR